VEIGVAGVGRTAEAAGVRETAGVNEAGVGTKLEMDEEVGAVGVEAARATAALSKAGVVAEVEGARAAEADGAEVAVGE